VQADPTTPRTRRQRQLPPLQSGSSAAYAQHLEAVQVRLYRGMATTAKLQQAIDEALAELEQAGTRGPLDRLLARRHRADHRDVQRVGERVYHCDIERNKPTNGQWSR
jgi:hypothetical protein